MSQSKKTQTQLLFSFNRGNLTSSILLNFHSHCVICLNGRPTEQSDSNSISKSSQKVCNYTLCFSMHGVGCQHYKVMASKKFSNYKVSDPISKLKIWDIILGIDSASDSVTENTYCLMLHQAVG